VSTFFLATFLIGFGLTLVSFLLGAIDASGIGHGGHMGGHVGDLSGGHAGDLSGGHAGHVDVGHGHAHAGDASHANATSVSPVNFQTLVAFMMGFGGFGYLAAGRSPILGLLIAIPVGVAGGLATAWIIYKWLRFLVRHERPLPPTSYVGTVGKLTVGIREGGTGEVVYTKNDTRAVDSARGVDGKVIAKGETVVIMRYERGVAYVQRLSEVIGQRPSDVPDDELAENRPRHKDQEKA